MSNDVQVIARREAIRRRHDLGLAPADELLAGVDRQSAARDGGVEAADGQQRTLEAAIADVRLPRVVDLVGVVGPELEAALQPQPVSRAGGKLFAREQIDDEVLTVEVGCLGERRTGVPRRSRVR